ncbi:MAG TPA: hemerythrin domain-containing protein [Usitatibacter sp.]|jgi:hemerythrin-like domain-containing protein|nr:hemerythrin domain-containing protein [Usitatibacter sp.]
MAISRSNRRNERSELFDTPAGFDEPLEMLQGCHRRIERQLETLTRLRSHVAERGVDAEASAAAQAVVRYFVQAAAHHHADEEKDLFPLLESRITDAGESARFRAFRESLEQDHRSLEAAWSRLKKPLEAIGEGLSRPLAETDVHAFVAAYAHHILTEETHLLDFCNRWLTEADRETLGRAMAARRKVAPPPRI